MLKLPHLSHTVFILTALPGSKEVINKEKNSHLGHISVKIILYIGPIHNFGIIQFWQTFTSIATMHLIIKLKMCNKFSVLLSGFSVRGMTEGITLLILAVQTGLIELQVIHRAFLLSIILFIVVASILQSMLEIADPIVLALGASRDK